MPDYTIQDVHVDAALSQISVAYMQQGFIADRLVPAVRVEKESDSYFVFGRENLRLDDTLRADGDEANETSFTISTDNYRCEEHALKDKITDRRRKNADTALNLERAVTEMLTQKILLRRELEVADVLFAAASFPNSNGTPATKWNAAGSDPFNDFETAVRSVRQRSGQTANTVVIGYQAFQELRNHADFLDRIKYVGKGLITPAVLADLLMVPNVLIGEAVRNTAQEGDTASYSFMWTDSVLVAHVAATPGLMTPSVAYRFNTQDREVRRWRNEERKADYIEVSDIYDIKLVGADCGYLLTDVLT